MLALACLGLVSSLALEPDSTVVPMELTDGGRAVVPVAILGRTYRLAVETGSPNVRLSVAVTKDLGLKPSSTGYGESTYALDSLRIGGVLVTGLEIGSGDEVTRLGVDGVLGLDAYEDYLLTVDYPGAKLVLKRGKLPEPDGKRCCGRCEWGRSSGWRWIWAG